MSRCVDGRAEVDRAVDHALAAVGTEHLVPFLTYRDRYGHPFGTPCAARRLGGGTFAIELDDSAPLSAFDQRATLSWHRFTVAFDRVVSVLLNGRIQTTGVGVHFRFSRPPVVSSVIAADCVDLDAAVGTPPEPRTDGTALQVADWQMFEELAVAASSGPITRPGKESGVDG